MTSGLVVAAVTCLLCFLLVPIAFLLARLFGIYTIVHERE